MIGREFSGALGLPSVTMFASGAPITCTGGAQLITIPEDSTEVSAILTCLGFNVSNTSVETAVFLDPGGSVVSDFVVHPNVGPAVQFSLVSDLETGQALIPRSPIIKTVTEPTLLIVVATSGAGAQLPFTFTSDVNEAAGIPRGDDSVTQVPESAP